MRVLFWIIMLTSAHLTATVANAKPTILDYVGECVPFARDVSGIKIWGNAHTWWDQAAGKYDRGSHPRVGAVLVFASTDKLRFGHVAVVSRIIEKRTVMVTHANWSRIGGKRGRAEQDVTLFDVSQRGDWSQVKVWYRDSDGLGGSTYPVYGFIYPSTKAAPTLGTSLNLTTDHPDYVGSLIDAYVP